MQIDPSFASLKCIKRIVYEKRVSAFTSSFTSSAAAAAAAAVAATLAAAAER